MRPHLDKLVASRQTLLARMQRRFHSANCPAVAAAVHNFLLTGEIHQASDNGGYGFLCTPALHTRNSIDSFVTMVGGGPVENCAVIGASGGRSSHYFNIVKLDTGIYYIDAFTRLPVFRLDPGDLISGYSRFEFFRNFSCERSV